MWTEALSSMMTTFWNLCLLRTGPERMPTAPASVATVVVLDLGLNVVGLTQMNRLSVADLSAFVVTMATIGVVTYAILSVQGLRARFAATFVAIVGSDVIITTAQILLLPLLALLGQVGFVILMLALLLWTLIVIGFIFQRALGVQREIGIALGMLVILIAALISGQVNPEQAAA